MGPESAFRLRYLAAWDHELCRAVAGVYVRAVLGFLRARARRTGVTDGRGGAVVMIQRFGGALNLNVHLHALVIDGVFAQSGEGLVFHPASPLTRDEAAAVLAVAVRRIGRLLERRGLVAASEEQNAADTWAEEAPVLAGLAAAAVEGRLALGPRRGARVARYGEPPENAPPLTLGPCHAALDGFDLHAGVVVRAGDRERLERLCRYTLRPPLALTRLRLDAEGQVCLALRQQWSDGTTHLRFEPMTLLERLAVLIPRPRINLLLYYGVLAPRAPWRGAVVALAGSEWSGAPPVTEATAARGAGARRGGDGYLWAELMRRTFGIDVLECPRCGDRLRLIALIEQAQIVDRILRHLGLPTSRPEARRPRAPPLDGGDDFRQADGATDATC